MIDLLYILGFSLNTNEVNYALISIAYVLYEANSILLQIN
jgi:hypothetical protein